MRQHVRKAWQNPLIRAFMLFSAFRAVYGAGILVLTYFLATSQSTPIWVSLLFLLCSMVFSRWLFRAMKTRWPNLFSPTEEVDSPTDEDI